MRPVLFQIGNFKFYSFGLMAALALIIPGVFIVRPLVKRRGASGDVAFELIVAAGVGGFLGARIYYIIENWGKVHADLWHVAFGGVGFTWYGGLIGGFLAVVLWSRVRNVPLGVVANAMAPAVALGYAIGRIGCQLSGDGDYGKVSGLPWAMGYPHGTVPTPPGVKVQPTPIYETVTMTLVAYILWRLATRYEKSGWWTFGWFLVLSGVERFLVEFVRRNPVWFWGLTQPQWVAIGSVIVGTALVLWYGKRPAERVAPEPRAARRAVARA